MTVILVATVGSAFLFSAIVWLLTKLFGGIAKFATGLCEEIALSESEPTSQGRAERRENVGRRAEYVYLLGRDVD